MGFINEVINPTGEFLVQDCTNLLPDRKGNPSMKVKAVISVAIYYRHKMFEGDEDCFVAFTVVEWI